MESTSLAEQERILASDWGGGKTPFGTSWSKFMMWIFIISDALTFAGFLIAYGFMRQIAPAWPDQMRDVFSPLLITFMTFVLISSSAVMAMAVSAAKAHDPKKAVRYIAMTVVGGAIFLGCQVFEWYHMIVIEHASLTHNNWGVPQFSAAFFVITGFHGFHVLSGLTILAIVALRAAFGKYSADSVENAGLYWHFVDVVWVFVFAFFYLM